jgi:K+ transporter
MLVAHRVVAVAVLAVTGISALWAWLVHLRRRPAPRLLAHLLALAQIVLVAQVGLGLLLLSDHRRAAHKLHYAYGTLALAAVLAPWLYAPEEPRRRLAWFGGATLVAAALAVRAYLTSS